MTVRCGMSNKSLAYWPSCHSFKSFLTKVKHVYGVIGGAAKLEKKGTSVYAPVWDEQNKTARFADINSLIVRPDEVANCQFAVNAVILELTAKNSDWIKKIPVSMEGNLIPSKALTSMIEDNFKGGLRIW